MWLVISCNNFTEDNAIYRPFRMSDGSLLIVASFTTKECDSKNQRKLRRMIYDNRNKVGVHIVIYHSSTWESLVHEVVELIGLDCVPWQYGDELWQMEAAQAFTKIGNDQIKEVLKVTAWYVPISNIITVESDERPEFALGLLKRPLIVEQQLVDFHHLVVVRSGTDEVVGVVYEDDLEKALQMAPVLGGSQRSSGTIERYMVPISNVLKFPITMSKAQIRVAIREEFDLFRRSRSIFLTDQSDNIIGFATEVNILED